MQSLSRIKRDNRAAVKAVKIVPGQIWISKLSGFVSVRIVKVWDNAVTVYDSVTDHKYSVNLDTFLNNYTLEG